MPFGGGARGPVDAKGLEPILHVRSIEAFMSTVCALSLENAFYVLQSIIIIMDFKDLSNKNGNVFFLKKTHTPLGFNNFIHLTGRWQYFYTKNQPCSSFGGRAMTSGVPKNDNFRPWGGGQRGFPINPLKGRKTLV